MIPYVASLKNFLNLSRDSLFGHYVSTYTLKYSILIWGLVFAKDLQQRVLNIYWLYLHLFLLNEMPINDFLIFWPQGGAKTQIFFWKFSQS